MGPETAQYRGRGIAATSRPRVYARPAHSRIQVEESIALLERGVRSIAADSQRRTQLVDQITSAVPITPSWSPQTILFVHQQYPTATLLASEAAWRRAGYRRHRQQQPLTPTVLRPDKEGCFHPHQQRVFDIQQMNPIHPSKDTSAASHAAWHHLLQVAASHNIPVHLGHDPSGSALNYYLLEIPETQAIHYNQATLPEEGLRHPEHNTIVLRDTKSERERVLLLSHELTHALWRHDGSPDRSEEEVADQEILAELSAFSVGRHYGMTFPQSLPYVQDQLRQGNLSLDDLASYTDKVAWTVEQLCPPEK